MDIQYCANHNEPILFIDSRISDPNQKGLCKICVQQKMNNQQEADEYQMTFDQLKSKPQKMIQAIEKVINEIKQYKIYIDVALDKMTCNLMQQIQILEQLINQKSSNLNIDACQQQITDQNQNLNQFIIQLQNLESLIKIDQIKLQSKELIDIIKMEKNQQQQFKWKYQTIEYKLLDNYGKKQTERCWAIAFNQDASLIFYGCNKVIKINEFENGRILKETQELNDHTSIVTCLDYMKNQNQLISASWDKSIIIWNLNEQHKWIIKQKLFEHKASIDSLILNQRENILISGSEDKTIKIFQIYSQNWICQQTIPTNFCVSGLCLDDESLQLIACGCLSLEILVIIYQKNKWIVKQTINRQFYQGQNYGLRLCFIDSNMFVFQPNESEYLELYEIDKQLNKFVKTSDIQVKNSKGSCQFFPCQFIKLRGILVVKNNAYLNILKRQENGQFMTQQSVDFQTPTSFGRVTNDGLYLATWDHKVNEIQIRKLKYIK